MYLRKAYGQSKINKCPFCIQQATIVNKQGINVCSYHREAVLNDLKCICGNVLDPRTGKFGLYFNCSRCGNVNLKKVLEINEIKDMNPNKKENKPKDKQREITIRSDDAWYCR